MSRDYNFPGLNYIFLGVIALLMVFLILNSTGAASTMDRENILADIQQRLEERELLKDDPQAASLRKDQNLEDRIYVRGRNLDFEVEPFREKGRVLIPVRAISDALGAETNWDGDAKKIEIIQDDKNLELTVDSRTVYVDDEPMVLDVPSRIKEGRTFVPLRFVTQAMGTSVMYSDKTGEIDIGLSEFKDFDFEQAFAQEEIPEDFDHGEREDYGFDDDFNYDDFENGDEDDDIEENEEDIEHETDWQRHMYEDYDTDNFQENEIFHERLDLDNIDYPRLNAAIFYHTNQAREDEGLDPLEYNENLELASFNHSLKMEEDDFVGHTNTQDSRRRTPSDRAELAGIDNPMIAENVARTPALDVLDEEQVQSGERMTQIQLTQDELEEAEKHTYDSFAEEVVESWMHSEGHRENILDEEALELGAGTYVSDGSIPSILSTQKFQLYEEVREKEEEPRDEVDPYEYN